MHDIVHLKNWLNSS